MSEKFEVIERGSDLPTAVNLSIKDAEYVDFNLSVLNRSQEAKVKKRRNPAGSVAEIDFEISRLLQMDTAPKSMKLAKKAANALGLSRREVSEIVQQLSGLYSERDVLLFPEFASAVSDSISDDLSTNQNFFMSHDLVTKVIECQASAFRTSVGLGSRATFESLTKAEKSFLEDLLLLLEVFVGVDEDAGLFARDSTFFDSMGSLTKDQLDALCRATENITFDHLVGAHYSPYVMLTLQALFSIDSSLTIKALLSKSTEGSIGSDVSRFDHLYTFLDTRPWDESLKVSRNMFMGIARDMQGTGVDSKVMNVCIHIFSKTGIDRKDLLGVVRKVLGPETTTSSSTVENAFLLAKCINFATPDLKIRNRNLANAYALKPQKAFKAITKNLKPLPTIDSPFIWSNYVEMGDVFEDSELHYLEWGFTLYAAAYKAGVPNYDNDTHYDSDKELCEHLGTRKGRSDLEALIASVEAIKDKTTKGFLSAADIQSKFYTNFIGPVRPEKTSTVYLDPKFIAAMNFQSTFLELKFTDLSVQSLAVNLLIASLMIEDCYDLKQFRYEIVDMQEASVALSKPHNPLELISGYRTLGACCMVPYQPGTYASMGSFYGNIDNPVNSLETTLHVDRTAYIFGHTEKGHRCLGTMFLPQFDVTYITPRPKVNKELSLSAGETAITLVSKGLVKPYPDVSRSFDGWEGSESTEGVPEHIKSEAVDLLVQGILSSSVGSQMGLLGDVASSNSIAAASSRDKDLISSVSKHNNTYVDSSRPSATDILYGEFSIGNPSSVFDAVTFKLTNPENLTFSAVYRTLSGSKETVDGISWEYMRYLWSFPKMANFIPLEGSVTFEVKKSDYSGAIEKSLMDLIVPEWFLECDTKPLIRGDRELKTADILEMRHPVGGIALKQGTSQSFIIDPK